MLTKLKSLKSNQGFMKYFKNTSWFLLEKILRLTVGLFVGILVARYLGEDVPHRFLKAKKKGLFGRLFGG